jgi:vacuolar-type H+-ATPase subunit I/STV1
MAVPGTYTVRMHIGEEMVAEQQFEVMKDPRLVDITQDDLIAQFELVQTINAKLDTTHKSINRIRLAMEEMKTLSEEIADNEELTTRLKELSTTISEIENELVQTKAEAIQDVLNFPIKLNNKLASLKSTVMTGYGRPTAQQYAVFEDLAGKVDVQLDKLNAIWNGEYEQVIEEIENPAVPINR